MARRSGRKKLFDIKDILIMVVVGLIGFAVLVFGVIMVWLPSVA